MESKRTLVDRIVESAGGRTIHDLDIVAFYADVFTIPVPKKTIYNLINKIRGGYSYFNLHYEKLKDKIDKDDDYIVERLEELGKVQG